ncbi:enoyl-CoA hydratase/isomerase family protein [Desulfoscipio geothermicus]|uniref:2-(1,2-epoxy-1,2-dihydrophenyl)acetyl-CoA isomerase n=1 Tax=Desulfoscipio geothermicus DSM 3669 TaxID=1121426 RepID=A0A1I6CQM0_9FIRM|nr:enoyl-CoA hydratase [Desulfoscipio geothermicus]SFQ95430.1 2-(1,2-epoxy-1,2-dihydrophenyl)acetyl-CoA isomerase [Desulfoscipio geothermicus DSM 3669]
MSFENILVFSESGITTITLNRPDAMNSLTFEMIEELHQLLEDISRDDQCKVIILTGSGKAFSAGGDIKAMSEGMDAMQGKAYLQKINGIILKIVEIEKIVISAVNGFAVGAGCNLSLASDLIVASNEAIFSEAFLPVGLVPDAGGTYFLPRILGLPKAKELVLTGKKLSAEEAERLGLINQVVPPEDLNKTVMDMAKEIAKGPSRAIGLTKVLMNRSLWMDLRSALEYEAYSQGLCMQTADHKEGLKAFREKRKPIFLGK